jgi:hypothetical protein
MSPFDAGDAELLARAITRLVTNGVEAHQLRVDLVAALRAAAYLAGDKTEAAELGLKLELLARGGRQG